MMIDGVTTDGYLRINEIKNFLYCPRICYYALCLRLDRETDLSRAGIAEEQVTKQRMKRRKHALHAVHVGERYFDVPVVSEHYQLVGKLDEIVSTPQGVYIVDYKDTARDYGYWTLQMLAYKLAVEEVGYNVLGSYVYIIPNRDYHEVAFKPSDYQKLARIFDTLHEMIRSERCPAPVSQIGKCRSCQYIRFCNDVS